MKLATEERAEHEDAERRRLVHELSDYLHDPLNPDRFVPSLEEEKPMRLPHPEDLSETPVPAEAIRRMWLVDREIGHPASQVPTETRQQSVEAHERMRQAPRNQKRMPRERKTAR
jgi:hypothetical protein